MILVQNMLYQRSCSSLYDSYMQTSYFASCNRGLSCQGSENMTCHCFSCGYILIDALSVLSLQVKDLTVQDLSDEQI